MAGRSRYRRHPAPSGSRSGAANAERQDRFIRRTRGELPGAGARVGLLSLKLKADTDDLRCYPALYVARRPLDAGQVVSAFDPAVRREAAERAAPEVLLTGTAAEVIDGAEAVVVATERPEFAQIDLAAARSWVARAVHFDGRGIIDPDLTIRAELSYRGIGRPGREP